MPSAGKKTGKNKYRDILYEVKDQVAWLTINRPRVLNVFREQSLDEMIDPLKSSREDPSIVCAVITGAGDKSFSGVDRIWLRGEQSHAKRVDHLESGVPIPAALLASLGQLATELQMDPLI